jgi:hypothetical protein
MTHAGKKPTLEKYKQEVKEALLLFSGQGTTTTTVNGESQYPTVPL